MARAQHPDSARSSARLATTAGTAGRHGRHGAGPAARVILRRGARVVLLIHA